MNGHAMEITDVSVMMGAESVKRSPPALAPRLTPLKQAGTLQLIFQYEAPAP
jgi:hypothetical protein